MHKPSYTFFEHFILNNKIESTSNLPTSTIIEASNNFSKSFTQEALASLVASFKCSILYKTNNPKQSCNPHLLTFSSLPHTYACKKWSSTLHVDNGQSLCMLRNILFLSFPRKVSYIPSPLSPKTFFQKLKALWVHVEPSNWLHELCLSKIVCHHF
jgi:hypothetical protein